MRSSTSLTVLVVVALLCTAPGNAALAEGWNLRLGGVWTNPDGETRVVDSDGQVIGTSADDAFGVGLSIEYMFSDRVGVEIGYLAGSDSKFQLDVDDPFLGELSVTDDLAFDVLDLSLNIRLVVTERTELYVGPVLADVSFDDLAFEVLGQPVPIGVDGATGFGLVAGIDVALGGGPWFFSGRLKYLDVAIDARPKDDPDDSVTKIDFNPFMVGAGFGVRF